MDLYTLPTPYPDETWYSIVSRYHRKSGNTKSTITSRELFGGTITSQKKVNPLALDNTVVDYVRLHGPTIGTAEECFSKYTLAPYQMRYYSEKRKEEVLERIFDASELKKTFVFTNHMYSRKQTMLRYCPLCLQEDIEKYGEAYWHRAHQIWVMDKCHKHGCNLLDADMSLSKATYHFTCADEISCPNDKVTYNESPFDSFTQYAFAALNAPFSFHCDADVDALIYAAVDRGYGKFYSRGFMCDAHKMYEDIQKKFGEEFIKKFFTADNGGATIRRVFRPNWNSRVEPAVLVATFLQAPIASCIPIHIQWLTTRMSSTGTLNNAAKTTRLSTVGRLSPRCHLKIACGDEKPKTCCKAAMVIPDCFLRFLMFLPVIAISIVGIHIFLTSIAK